MNKTNLRIIDRLYVIDFDRCLGNTEEFFSTLLDCLSDSTNLSPDKITNAKLDSEAKGDSFSVIDYIVSNDPMADIDKISRKFTDISRNNDNIFEKGSKEFIGYLSSNHQIAIIMSFGEKRWQEMKIKACSFHLPFMIVDTKDKGGIITKWLKDGYYTCPDKRLDGVRAKSIILIDDNYENFINLPNDCLGYWIKQTNSLKNKPNIISAVDFGEIIKSINIDKSTT